MGPVRLPFGLGSLCLPADVSETHTCSGALKQTGAIRHSSRYTRSVGTRPWFRSNGPQTVGQRPSLVMNPPYHESYSLVPLYPLHSNQPRPSLPLFMVRSFFTQALERTEVAQVSQVKTAP
ncbi:Glycine cleavage system H protein [Dissostichus eleginoides]|uniref:Glycine cleavage system H protein n=1 Tax=Dissostichus eleginoides TaxID=100907 RepID=A0AAD9FNT0_DISEL|nr:Glycine cleavage system H protein [Dissostichus eleginoides]